MKVLHLISGGDTGGAKTHVFSLMNSLKNKIDAKIICLTDGPFYREILELGVDAELVQQKNRFDLSVVDAIARIFKDGGYNLVHCHGARANFIAWQLKRKTGCITLTTVHSDYRLDFDGFYRKVLYTGLNMVSLRKMDYYIGVSSNFKDMLIKRGFSPNDVYTVYNCVNFAKEPSFLSREEFAKRIGITDWEDKIFIGIIGRHDYVKGHDVFIRAAKKVCEQNDKARFIIAGDEEGLEPIKALAAQCGIEDKVFYTGFVRDIYSFINFIDINTLTSRSESFPYVLLEGAKMKKPTVASRVGGIPDLIVDGKTGMLFESEDYNALAEKLTRLLSNAELSKNLGENLYEYAKENFSDASLAKTHIDIYEDVVLRHKRKEQYDVVISGYYGFRNSGDDALLFAILDGLKKEKPDLKAVILSAHPAETRELYRTDAVYRFNVFSVLNAIKNAKMLISGGGSLIQDETSSLSLYYYLSVMRAAKRFGKKLYVFANGMGPIKNRNIEAAANVLKMADMITLRDKESLKEFERMGLKTDNILVTADPAVTLAGSSCTRVEEIFENEKIPEGNYIGVAIRPWAKKDRHFEEKIAASLDYIAERHNLIPIFIPMKYTEDFKTSQRVSDLMNKKGYVLSKGYSVADTIGITAKMDIIVGMRLHTLIYAAAASVPAMGLVYDPKVSGFLDYSGQEYKAMVEDFEADEICAFADDVMKNRQIVLDKIAEKTKILKDKANENAKIAIEMLKGDGKKDAE